jgi:hypothetical protein
MNISATWSSSRIATRVSWALEEMIISLVMPDAPCGRGRSLGAARAHGIRGRHAGGAQHRQAVEQESDKERHEPVSS